MGHFPPYNTYITQYPKTAVLLKKLYKHVIEIHVLMKNTLKMIQTKKTAIFGYTNVRTYIFC